MVASSCLAFFILSSHLLIHAFPFQSSDTRCERNSGEIIWSDVQMCCCFLCSDTAVPCAVCRRNARKRNQEHCVLCILWCSTQERSAPCVLHLLDTEKNCVLHSAVHGEELCFALAWQCVLHLLDTEKKLGGARSAEAGSTVSGVLQSCRQQQSEIISWDPSQDRLFDSNNLRISYNWPN